MWLSVAVGICAVLLRFRSFQTVFGRRPFLKDDWTDLERTIKRHESSVFYPTQGLTVCSATGGFMSTVPGVVYGSDSQTAKHDMSLYKHLEPWLLPAVGQVKEMGFM